MDIAGLSMAMAKNTTMSQVGTALLAKNLDVQEQQGASMVAMMDRSMELSVNPYVGANFDMSV